MNAPAPPPGRSKPMSDTRRVSEVYVRYGPAFRDIPQLDGLGLWPETDSVPDEHVPRPSKDASLTAFAQLACIRMGVSRVMISLLDEQRQHILAEATPDLLLRAKSYGSSDDASSALWLGSTSIPRSWGCCEQVLDIVPGPAAEAVIVVNDLTQSPSHANRIYVKGAPHLRFYVGVPLVSSKGAIVGGICIFDDQPRLGLSKDDSIHLQDLAATVVEHLDMFTIKDQYRRGERLTRALMSFADGGSAVRSFESDRQMPPPKHGSPSAASHAEPNPLELAERVHLPKLVASSPPASPRYGSVMALQESILPAHSRTMFARAASVIRDSSDLDGVLMLDASVAGIGNQHRDPDSTLANSDGSSAEAEKSSSNEDEGDKNNLARNHSKSSSTSSSKTCGVLGFATPNKSDLFGHTPNVEYASFLESDLTRLLRTYPNGKVFAITSAGDVLSSTDESDSSSASAVDEQKQEQPRARSVSSNRRTKLVKAFLSMLPGARSIAFIPFWDYERSRWFAGCLCWSNRPDRQLSERVDLAYFKIFGHSIMRDLSRLDALASNQAKTSFVASISHELRSPLHGILGTLEFLKDTALDSFQLSMLNSLDSCGRTLLDTINHLLEYAKISGTSKTLSSKKLKGSKQVRMSSRPLTRQKRDDLTTQEQAVDLGLVTEETIEAIFSGQSKFPTHGEEWDTGSETDGTPSEDKQAVKRNDQYIILDIAHEEDWTYCLPVGSWRRIVMNLFNNALKFTESGYVYVSLKSTPPSEGADARNIILSIKDSGRGMSAAFLANRAFEPFTQEDSLSSGNGLGLSIVRKIIENLGGRISLSSDPGQGSEIRVKITLPKQVATSEVQPRPRPRPQRVSFLATLPQLQGRRICILYDTNRSFPGKEPVQSKNEGLTCFATAMVRTLTEQLRMNVIQTDQWEGHDADLVICPEPSFEYLASIRRKRTSGRRAPVTIFVAMDALEAFTLRTDARVLNRESVVEVMTQPCGPFKLANILDHCLNRFTSPEENLWSPLSPVSSPWPQPSHVLSSMPMSQPSPADAEAAASHSSDSTYQSAIGNVSLTNEKNSTEGSRVSDFDADTKPIGEQDASGTPVAKEYSGSEQYPAYPPDATAAAPGNAIFLPVRSKPLPSRVLVTDDNAVNRKLLVVFLKKHGIAYQEAENGQQALQAYQEAAIRFDVVLMDISMPIMDGMTATRAIRDYEQKINIPRAYIIALTGLTSASARLEAWSSGVDRYVTKPVNFGKLEGLLREEEGLVEHNKKS